MSSTPTPLDFAYIEALAFGDPRLPELFWEKLHVDAYGCWQWDRYVTDQNYGRFTPSLGARSWLVHRYVWTHLVGPIPEGLVLDHHCEQKNCARPQDLEPVTRAVNNARKKIAHLRREARLARVVLAA